MSNGSFAIDGYTLASKDMFIILRQLLTPLNESTLTLFI